MFWILGRVVDSGKCFVPMRKGKGMLSSVEQAFVGRDEKRAPLKKPVWKAISRPN